MPKPRYIGSCRERNLCCSGRDSSCSIPIAQLNHQQQPSPLLVRTQSISLIGNLLGQAIQDNNGNDAKECYCDSACITLGDCCPDYKDTCGVQDCIVSDWEQWSECNIACGVGTMNRTRRILSPPQNGGRECPDLNQRRACHGQHCKVKDDEKMLREMAIILQSSFSVTRNIDADKDIRRNLRLNYPKDPLKENINEYCVLFEVNKSHKSCETLTTDVYAKLQEGKKVCVHCQDAAMRSHLGYRCNGHGIKGRATRWSLFNFSGCNGRWTRIDDEQQSSSVIIDGHCHCKQHLTITSMMNITNTNVENGNTDIIMMKPDFIFV
nr:somatomedin-B and thrombospondin type-1 domain-containing protein-like [Dermatophagoides farinae]